jgi:hypothetical protein
MKRYLQIGMLLCIILAMFLPLSVSAQGRNIRVQPVSGNSPNRPNIPTPTPRPSSSGIGTSSSALTSCEAKVYNETLDAVIASGFAANAWVLVIVPNGDDQLTFWWRADSNGTVYIDQMRALLPGVHGDDLYGALLVGQNGPILGHCSNRVQQSAQSLYNYYQSLNPIPLEILGTAFVSSLSPDVLEVVAAQEVDDLAIISQLDIGRILVGEAVITVPDMAPDPHVPINEGFLTSGIGVSNAVTNNGGDLWNFSSNAGDMVRISVVSEQFDTYLTLYDANLNMLFEDDDSGGNLNSLIDGYVLPYSGDYVVNVRAYDHVATGGYTLFLDIIPFEPAPVAPSGLVCGGYTTRLVVGGQAQRAGGTNVRIRNNPSRSAQQIGLINNNTPAVVLDGPQCVDNVPWWQLNYNGIVGWAGEAADGLILLAPAGNVPAVQPTQPPPQPVLPTHTPVVIVPTAPPPAASGLNYGLSPNFGSAALASGFTPDPYTVGITSGGSVDASYLGGSCLGFATSAPHFRLKYTSGSFPLLRFYFIGSGDTTLIINNPNGGWHCVDDSYSTLNPTIDFNSPASGQYDIWVGSYSSGNFVSGTLYITEVDSNHP